jgi:hypothetical protein
MEQRKIKAAATLHFKESIRFGQQKNVMSLQK